MFWNGIKNKMAEDFELLDKIKKGDLQAFEEIVKKYKMNVFNTIYSVMGNIQDADDIMQDVFIKVYNTIGKFKGQSSFSTWLYRITVNKCIDELRKRKNKFLSYESELSDEEIFKLKNVISDEAIDIIDELRKKEIEEILRKTIDLLPEKFRIVLTLREIDNLSYKEISDVMNVSVNRVKILLFRARQKLKEKLKNVL